MRFHSDKLWVDAVPVQFAVEIGAGEVQDGLTRANIPPRKATPSSASLASFPCPGQSPRGRKIRR